jgi:hypothetical protein
MEVEARHGRMVIGGGGPAEGLTMGTGEGIHRVLVQEAEWIHRIYACILPFASSSDPDKLKRMW